MDLAAAILSRIKLDAQEVERQINDNRRLVLANPCGSGKTLRVLEFISRNWKDGVLYVAERIEQLDDAKEKLISWFGVPSDAIKVYHSSVEDKFRVRCQWQDCYVGLITHTRLQIDNPVAFTSFGVPVRPRRFMFVDEAMPPVTVIGMPRMLVEGFLSRAGVHLGFTTKDAVEANMIVSRADTEIDAHAARPFHDYSVKYCTALNYGTGNMASDARRYILKMTLVQVLMGNYLDEPTGIKVLVPLAPHLSWGDFFEHVTVLDATARFSEFIYPGFKIVGDGHDFRLINRSYKYVTTFDLSKTNIRNHKEAFLEFNMDVIREWIENFSRFKSPYVVTFKELEKEVADRIGHSVFHYGSNRGSNNFLKSDSVVLIGAYRLPVEYIKLVKMVYPNFNEVAMAVGCWIQEIFRTRIRTGIPVDLLFAGDRSVVEAFENILSREPEPVGAFQKPSLIFDRILKTEKTQGRRLIIECFRNNIFDFKEITRKHFNYDSRKSNKSLRGLINKYPQLNTLLKVENDFVKILEPAEVLL